ncbi:putative membrane protein, partial [Vibrio parahaemolyticus AQ3810]
FLAQWLLPLVR